MSAKAESRPATTEDADKVEEAKMSQSDTDTVEKAADTSEQPNVDARDSMKGLPLAITILSLSLIMFCCAIEMTIVSTAIPRITNEFQSLDDIGWYGAAYFMCIAAWQPAWGKILKYFPINIVFAASAVGFNIGCTICAVAQNSETLIAGRAVQGALAGGLPAGIYTIIAFIAPPKQKPMYLGALAAIWGIANVLGPIIGGLLTTHASWRWVFWINLPISFPGLIAFLVFFKAPASAAPSKATLKEKFLQMDLPGGFTIMGAIICYILAMQDGGVTRPWNSSRIIGLLVGFGLLSLLFIGIQYFSGDYAIFRGRFVKDRTLMVMCVIAAFVVGGFQIVLYYMPIYFQSTRNLSAAKSGTNLLPLVLVASAAAIICGGVMMSWGRYVPIILIGAIPMTIGGGLLYTLDVDTSTGKWVGYQILIGTGVGLVLQIPVMVAQSVVDTADLSTITAIIMWCQTIGASIWVSAAEAGFANKLLERLPVEAPNVDPSIVLATGASDLTKMFNGDDLSGVVESYMSGLRVPFAMIIACFGVVTAVAPLARWGNLKGKIAM